MNSIKLSEYRTGIKFDKDPLAVEKNNYFKFKNCLFGATDILKNSDKEKYLYSGSFGSPKKKFNINFTKTNTKFCLHLHYNADNSYLFVDGKEIFKFKS